MASERFAYIEGFRVDPDAEGAAMMIFQVFNSQDWSEMLRLESGDELFPLGLVDEAKFAGAVATSYLTHIAYGLSVDNRYGYLRNGKLVVVGMLFMSID